MITIIPAIDLIDGKCVRLTKGDYSTKKVYNEDPLEVALQFEANGLQRLHLVDLDGAKEKHVVNWKVLEKIAVKTNLVIDFGGGIKTDGDLKIVFESGSNFATVGSVAVKEKSLFKTWIDKYGPDKIILGADVNDKKISITGWTENTDIDLFDFLEEYINSGIKSVICTDIKKDGMLQGTAFDLYKEISSGFPDLDLIASGGISGMDDLYRLNEMNIFGAIVGKAIYEGVITLEELKDLIPG